MILGVALHCTTGYSAHYSVQTDAAGKESTARCPVFTQKHNRMETAGENNFR